MTEQGLVLLLVDTGSGWILDPMERVNGELDAAIKKGIAELNRWEAEEMPGVLEELRRWKPRSMA